MKRLFVKEIAVLLVLALLIPMFSVAEDVQVNLPGGVPGATDSLEVDDLMEVELEDEATGDDLLLDGLSDALTIDELQETPSELDGESDAEAETEENAAKKYGVPTQLTLGVKEAFALKCTKKDLTYKSSSAKIAKVDDKGVITPLKKGKATIAVYSKKKKLTTCKVTVVPAPKKVTLDMKSVTLGVKETIKLNPAITKGSHTTLTFASANQKIATVSNTGKIVAKKTGSTTITVKTHNGKKAKLTVLVRKAPKKVTMEPTTASLKTGETLKLTAKLPENTASQIKWTSSNPQIATVNEKGVVTAMAAGDTTITAKTFNKKKATCAVSVRMDNPESPFYEMIDLIDIPDGEEGVDPESLKMSHLSAKDYEDIKDGAKLVAAFNKKVDEYNADVDAYNQTLEDMADAIGQMADSLGWMKITDTDDGITIESEVMSFSLVTNMSNVKPNARKNAFEVNFAGENILLVPNHIDDNLAEKCDQMRSWLERVGNYVAIWTENLEPAIKKANENKEQAEKLHNDNEYLVNRTKDKVTEHEGYVKTAEKNVENAREALKKAREEGKDKKTIKKLEMKVKDLGKKLTQQKTDLNRVQKNYDTALKNLNISKKALDGAKNVLNGLQYLGTAIKTLAHANAEAMAAILLDIGVAKDVVMARLHKHPATHREQVDIIRSMYCDLLDAAILETEAAILKDLVLVDAMVCVDLIMTLPSGWGKKLLAVKVGPKWVQNLAQKCTNIISSSIFQTKWVQKLSNTAVYEISNMVFSSSSKDAREEVDVAHSKLKHYEDILHGEIRGIIIGWVIDRETKKPIEGVMVQMGGENGASGYNPDVPADATTNARGGFLLNTLYGSYRGDYSLCLYHDHYKPAFAEAQLDEEHDQVEITIEMEPAVFFFGHYDQDNNLSNGMEPIEWIELARNGDTVTMISKYGLDAKPYNTVRSWLNSTFLNTAFTSEEQARIQTVRVTAEDNPYYDTEAGSDTYDKVWLLSIREAKDLFSSDAARVCYPTATAKANGCWTHDGRCWWWLRSSGDGSSKAAGVSPSGYVFVGSDLVEFGDEAVRPVVCLRLS